MKLAFSDSAIDEKCEVERFCKVESRTCFGLVGSSPPRYHGGLGILDGEVSVSFSDLL